MVCSSPRREGALKKNGRLAACRFLRVKGGMVYTKKIQVSRANSGIRMPTDQAI